MIKENNKIITDIKQLLEDYLHESYIRDLMNSLYEDISLQMDYAEKISGSEKAQIDYEPPKGINYRIAVDKVITYCESILPEEKYFHLLLDFSELMFYEGEISYSMEIAEDILGRINSNGSFSGLRAEVNLMISKIHWSQAYWNECNQFISTAIKIFRSIGRQPRRHT